MPFGNIPIEDVTGITASASDIFRTYVVGAAAGDIVYQKSDGTVDKASCTTVTTGKVIGAIVTIDDPSAGSAKIRFSGDLGGFSGLVTGKMYILGQTPGSIVAEDDTGNPDYPNVTVGSGHVIAEVGTAASADTLYLQTNRDFEEV